MLNKFGVEILLADIPTVWLLEGLLMYLDEAEVSSLLQTISDLSVTGSYIGADLVSVRSWQVGSQHRNGLVSKVEFCLQNVT